MLTPVVFPVGREKDVTKPDPSMSSVTPTIGIDGVAFCAARMAKSPPAEIASTRSLANSAAQSQIWSTCCAQERQSILRFLPSMKM